MQKWKCDQCGYTFDAYADNLPDVCPSCGQKCTFLNVTCYIPDCKLPDDPGFDPRIGDKDK